MDVQLHCVIKKGFSWRGKKFFCLRRSTSEISKGNSILGVKEKITLNYNIFLWNQCNNITGLKKFFRCFVRNHKGGNMPISGESVTDANKISKLKTPCHFFKLQLKWSRCKNSVLKGIVHPKIKMISLVTHHHVVPNSKTFIFGTQINIFLMKSKGWADRRCHRPSPMADSRAVTVCYFFLPRWSSNKYCGLAVNRMSALLQSVCFIQWALQSHGTL